MNARALTVLGACVALSVLGTAWVLLLQDRGDGSTDPKRVAARAVPVADQFERDDTTLGACAAIAADKLQRCIDQAYGNLAISDGPRAALARLKQAADSETLGAVNCHRVAHSIGAAAITRAGGDPSAALGTGDGTCASGYYHGVVERALAGVDADELGESVSTLCNDHTGEVAGQCLHGLGHGLMLRTAYDLPAALEACSMLEGVEQDQCDSGTFMENHSTSYGTTSPWLRDDDLTWPCGSDAVTGSSRDVCWLTVAARAATALDYDLAGVYGVCDDAPRDRWRQMCVRNLGELAAEQAGYDPQRSIDACRVVDDPLFGTCLQGAATITVARFGTTARATALCDAAPKAVRRTCAAGIIRQSVEPPAEAAA